MEEFTNVKSGISLLRAFSGNSIACVNRRIIQEEQQKKSNYKYTFLSLAFNFLLFFDRLNKVEHEPELSHSDTMNYVRKIVNYMELHYMEEIKARDYARSCGLSGNPYAKNFSEYTNMSPSEYLNVVRINKACELLAHGNDSIEDISRAAGRQ